MRAGVVPNRRAQVCVGFVYKGGLFYVVTDGLVRFDLGTHKVSNATTFFPAPMAFDPAHPGSMIAVTEASPGHTDGGSGGARYPSSALVRFDLGTGVKTELYVDFDARDWPSPHVVLCTSVSPSPLPDPRARLGCEEGIKCPP